MRSTNCEKFRLLLWKNWALQWNHKLQLLYEVCAPMLVSLLLVGLRLLVKSTHVDAVRYSSSFDMTDFNLLFHNHSKYVAYRLGYSPASCAFCTQILTEVGNQSRVGIYPFESSSLLEDRTDDLSLIAGVDFGDQNKDAVSFPTRLAFSIRFPSELRTSRNVLQTWNTNKLYLPLDPSGPRNSLDEDGGTPSGYLKEGFLTIQNQVSLAYIKLAASRPPVIPEIKIKRFPHPPYIEDPLLHSFSTIMALIVLLCYIQPAIHTVKYVALEKEKQLKEVLKIMGLSNWLHWAAWFAKTFTIMLLSTILVTYVLTTKWSNEVAIFTSSSFSAILCFLLVYVVASITFCFMMATFFNKASTAAAVTGLYWFTSFFPYAYVGMNYDSVSTTAKLLSSTLANTSLGLGIRIITEWEMTGHGMDWHKMFEQSAAGDPLKMIHIIAMMLAMAAVHMLVCLYVEQVRPGSFGVPKPWNFPFRKTFWVGEPALHVDKDNHRQVEWDPSSYESEPLDKDEGVVLSNLCKWFGRKQAVENLSFSMYVNEITVLLGHNGAGKTTTISILIGMIQPTSGTAYIMGHDIRTDIDGAREYLSICPQHNVLFDGLTVRDHLGFFAYLRGLRGEQLEEEITSYLEKMDLNKKADTLSADLSGGMQRKLSICCAFCGGASVVFCDEPSSGMDPTARRQLWNILQQEKEGRVILLTTHFMDEADVLADRVAIMAAGHLTCYGTSFFLKKKFGSGYTLICVKEHDCDTQDVTEFLRKSIPSLEVNDETDTEISYILADQYSPLFGQMLSDFEGVIVDLKISGFGLSHTSLEEVFMKATAEMIAMNPNEADFNLVDTFFSETERLRGLRLKCSQLRAMLLKKYLNMRRNGALIAVQFMMVIVFVVLSVVVRATELYTLQHPMTIELQQYDEAKVVLDAPKLPTGLVADFASNLANIVKGAGPRHHVIHTDAVPFEEFVLSIPARRRHLIYRTYIAGFTITEQQYLIWLNNKPLHSAPIGLNLLHNALARTFLGPDVEIAVINHPLPYGQQTKMYLADTGLGLGTQLAVNAGLCMSLITASFCLFIIRERQSKAKLLQFVSGVEGLTFWLTHFIWDFAYLTILALVFLLALAMFEEEAYSRLDELARNFLMFLCFGFSALPLTYLMSRRYAEPANGFAKLSIYNLFFGVGIFAVAFVLSLEVLHLRDVEYKLETLALIYPHFALAKALHTLYINHRLHNVCEPLLSLDDAHRCKVYVKCCELTPYLAWERPGIGRPIRYLLSSGLFYFFLMISIQYRLTGALWDKYLARRSSKKYVVPKPKDSDSDVAAEMKLIDEMTRREIVQYNLVMKRLTKFYGNFLAVNQLSVAIKEAECFGLLGLNGAGKSTTFKMLTLDAKTTFGTAYVKGMNVQTQTKDVYQEIGYCPQSDALFSDFTGRETLRIFAMIHGIPKQRIAQLSENLAKAFGFIKHYDNRVGNYSGGNKRKLSTAVAVIGGPSVVLLDEPTSGMDPASRRRLWNVINSIRKAGKSIVLTSHSMDECVALCTRMGIMVSGEFRCLGSIQHLRIKYSQGLVLTIKVISMQYPAMNRPSMGYRPTSRRQTDVRERAVELWVQEQFPDAELKDKFQGLLSYNIPMVKNLWSRLFAEMEFVKGALFIEDYSITQTNLEEIFLYFTKH